MKKGIIFNIQKFCLHDGDGIRTCVFLKGCPLRCIWCHNPESIEKEISLFFDKTKCSLCGRCTGICTARDVKNSVLTTDSKTCVRCGKCVDVCLNDANEIIGTEKTASEILDEVMKDKMFYDTSGGGLTVTGGEPSYQADFTLELLGLAKNSGISIAVETCGAGTLDFYESAADMGTTFLYDIKCIDPVLHRKLTGSDNSHIMENLQYLMDRNADIIIRIPLIPGCNDSDKDISLLAEFLNKNTGRYRYAEIMPYHNLGTGKSEKLGKTPQYIRENAGEAEISRWCDLFRQHKTEIRVSE